MAQLRDDCFAGDGALLPLDEALDRIFTRVDPLTETEVVPLDAAYGRVLAADLVPSRDVPPKDNTAVDGFAVFHADLAIDGDTRLPVGGRAAAGHPLGRAARRGEAIRVFTGAMMPEGPDTVFMEEDCRVEDGHVVLPPGLKQGANRRRAGEDVKAGRVIVAAGSLLRAQEVGLAASIGVRALEVVRRVRAAVFSTGDEVREPGADAPEGCIYDANRYTVIGMLRDLGCTVTDLGILPDDADVVRGALSAAARDQDAVFTSGGVSLGEEDHVAPALRDMGSLHFWRLAVKPGRPIAMGQIDGTVFMGLPGNPAAAAVTFLRVARPLILRLAGRRDLTPHLYRVRAGFSLRKKLGRREWVRVRLSADDSGQLVAQKYPVEGAGILSSLVEADGLVELPEDLRSLEEGSPVDYLPFNEVVR